MKRYFKNSAHQEQYDRDGYVILDGSLEPAQIEELRQLFKTVEPPNLNKMYCNIYDRTPEENAKIDQTILRVFENRFNATFNDCRMVQAVFLAKGNGPGTASQMHQDWSSVDENNFESMAMWTPLEDVDESNGCIYVVKGSHRLFSTIRSMTIPKLYLDFDKELEPYLTAVPMKAGQTLVYAHNLFHGSKPKFQGDVRPATIVAVMPLEAKSIYYFNDSNTGSDLVEWFETDIEFYLNGISKYMDRKRPADLPKIGETRDKKFIITREDFFETMRRARSSVN